MTGYGLRGVCSAPCVLRSCVGCGHELDRLVARILATRPSRLVRPALSAVFPVTFLDYPDGRDEYIAERLLDRDDIAAWRAETEHGRLSHDEMVRRWADERRPVMAEYEAWSWGWWNSDGDEHTMIGKGADDVDYPGAP